MIDFEIKGVDVTPHQPSMHTAVCQTADLVLVSDLVRQS